MGPILMANTQRYFVADQTCTSFMRNAAIVCRPAEANAMLLWIKSLCTQMGGAHSARLFCADRFRRRMQNR